jgi:hypothetical protein
MHINFNEQLYRVDFSYITNGKVGVKNLTKIKNKKIKTKCEIFQREGEDWKLISTGTAIRDRADDFVKGGGRRVALGKALGVFTSGNVRNYDLRKSVWDIYFKNHKDGKQLNLYHNEVKKAN